MLDFVHIGQLGHLEVLAYWSYCQRFRLMGGIGFSVVFVCSTGVLLGSLHSLNQSPE